MNSFDLVVLGTGPAASRVAKKCASEGMSVAIVEAREFGGTCALRGCNPKKVFVRAAELVDWAQRANVKLACSKDVKIDWGKLVDFKRQFTEPVKEKSEASYQDRGIATFSGHAQFHEPQVIEVGNELLKAKKILIAVGATPAPLEFPGHELITLSDEFMELDHLPENILFIGGGYISFEFAHVAARAGATVKILDHGPQLLKKFDPDLVKMLLIRSHEAGIDPVVNAEVTKIKESNEGRLVISANVAGKVSSFSTDLVVHGAGRVPNLDGMQLEVGNVEYDAQGVIVNEFLQSVSNPAVFAAGDCAATGVAMLTPAANQQGRTIVMNLLAGEMKHKPDYGAMPSAVYTVPSLASVGLLESKAIELGLDFESLTGDMSKWGSVRKVCESCAGYKILVQKKTDRVLGAHLLGPDAAETINLFAIAMKFGLTAKDMKSVLFTFPSFSADVRSML